MDSRHDHRQPARPWTACMTMDNLHDHGQPAWQPEKARQGLFWQGACHARGERRQGGWCLACGCHPRPSYLQNLDERHRQVQVGRIGGPQGTSKEQANRQDRTAGAHPRSKGIFRRVDSREVQHGDAR
eukprot:365070-Chlamydomonas_euryale.AAC.10